MTKIYSDFNLKITSPLSRSEYQRLMRAMNEDVVTPNGSRVSFCKQRTGEYPIGIEIENTSWYEKTTETDSDIFYRTVTEQRAAAAHFAVRRLMTRIGRTFNYSI